MKINLVRNKIFSFILLILVVLVLFVLMFICLHNEKDAKVYDELFSVGARCRHYLNSNFNKKLLAVYCVDSANFQKVIEILPKLTEPYSISISGIKLTQSDIKKLSQNHNMVILTIVDFTCVLDGHILKSLATCTGLCEFGIGGRRTDMPVPIKSFNTALRIIITQDYCM